MRSHVFAIVRSCFAALRQVRSVRRSLMWQTPLSLVHALGVSKFDYCNSIQRLCTPFGQIAVRAECRCPANLLVTEVRTQPVTPWTLLIASSGENPIPTVCSGISLPSRHGTVVPYWQSTPGCQCRRSSLPPLGQHSVTGHSINLAHDTWLRPEHGTTFYLWSGPRHPPTI